MSASANGHTTDLRELQAEHNSDLVVLTERLAELELANEELGWLRMSFESDREFSRDGLRRIMQLARLMYLKHPLINHAVEIQTHYVMGQGVRVQARVGAVNAVVQAFWDDPKNQVELTSDLALMDKERELQVGANLFFALFVHRPTGRLRVRTIPVDEIEEVVCNPDDAKEPWFYKRVWQQRTVGSARGVGMEPRSAFYPDWRYNPPAKPDKIGDVAVAWDTPVAHWKVGGLPDMRFGVPEVYSALDWARAVTRDLEDWSKIRAAHARFAWKATTEGGRNAVAAIKAKLGTTFADDLTTTEHNPPPGAASTLVLAKGREMEPIRTAGAAPSPEEGRRLGLMVAAGVGVPETMLFGDADVGNLATSKTLDRPTELKMEARRSFWSSVLLGLIDFAIDQSVLAPNGLLKGVAILDTATGERQIVLAPDPDADPLAEDYDPSEPMNRHIDVNWPNLLDRDVKTRVDAVVAAAGALSAADETERSRLIARELLLALDVDDVDEELDALFPEAAQSTTADQATAGIAAEARFTEALRNVQAALERVVG